MNYLSAIFKSLSDDNRLRIISALMQHNELCSFHLIELIGVSPSSISKHMAILIDAGLVASRKKGRWVYYRLNRHKSAIDSLLTWIEIQLTYNKVAQKDGQHLAKLVDYQPEDLCRKQRGESCCPPVQKKSSS